MQVIHFALHAQLIFAPLIPDDQQDNPVWVCLQQHLQYVTLLMQTSYTRSDVMRLDKLIFSQQTLFLSIPQYFMSAPHSSLNAGLFSLAQGAVFICLCRLWRPKNHFAQHFPVDIMRYGPHPSTIGA